MQSHRRNWSACRGGPVIAGRIATYRERHGSFAEVGHLQRVSGIGPKTMEDLAPLLVAGAPSPSEEETPEE